MTDETVNQVYEVKFYTEHREIVEVSAPCESDAIEAAEMKRDRNGELVQTVHTEARELREQGKND